MERVTAYDVFQPGEADWASWKCGGGPHQQKVDSIGEQRIAVPLPYSGTESSPLDRPVTISPMNAFQRYRASLPA